MLKIAHAQTQTYMRFADTILNGFEDGLSFAELKFIATNLVARALVTNSEIQCPHSLQNFHKDRRVAIVELLLYLEECYSPHATKADMAMTGHCFDVTILEAEGDFFYSHMPHHSSRVCYRFQDALNSLYWVHSNKILRWRDEMDSWETENNFESFKKLFCLMK